MSANVWPVILQAMALQLPNLGVGAVGFCFAFARRRRHPRASNSAMVGFGALLLSALLFLGMQLWIQSAMAAVDGPRVSGIVSQWNLVGFPLNLISLAALAFAVFIDRRSISDAT